MQGLNYRHAALRMVLIGWLLAASSVALAANFVWDPNKNGTGSDGSANWDLSAADNFWVSGGSDVVWPNTNTSIAVFGVGGAGTQTATINAAITANGLAFNAGPNYTIASSAPATNTLTLAGSTPTITVAAGIAPTISAPILGTSGLTYIGTNTSIITFAGTNTYTGTTTVDGGGTLKYTADNSLGALTFGIPSTTPFSTTPSSLDLSSANLTATSLLVQVNSSAANTFNIGSGKTFTVNGGVTIGPNTNLLVASGVQTVVNMTGGGSFVVNGGATNFLVGQLRNNADAGTDPTATLDLSGLNSFTFNGTGEFRIGYGGNITGTTRLASASGSATNSITATALRVGDSNNANNGGASAMSLGQGTNIINANTIVVGSGKSAGTLNFIAGAPSAASVTIAGTPGGTNTANITVGQASSATFAGGTSSLNLVGHIATVQAGTVTAGQLSGATGGTSATNDTGQISFDTGTFTANTLNISNDSSGNDAAGIRSSFTLGTNSASTGTLNVNTAFNLGNITSTSTTAHTDTAVFSINGGTANINSDIVANSNASNANITLNSTLVLAGGTLNMMGHSIGSAAKPITTVTLPIAGKTATIQALGGTGINGAGLTMAGTGSLVLAGNNTYLGNTTVSGGALVVTGNTPAASNVNVNGGSLLGTGTVNGPVMLNSGNLGGGLTTASTSGTLNLANGLTLNSGNLMFNIGTSSSNVISVTGGSVAFNGGGLTLALAPGAAPTSGSQFNVLTYTSPLSQGSLSLSPVVIGRTTLTPSINGNKITVTTSGAAASLVWDNSAGSGGDGATWNNAGSVQNWNSTAPSNPFVFFDGDNVTFNDSNNGHYTVNIDGTVMPSTMIVSSNNNTYSFNNGTIGGSTSVVKNGNGGLSLNAANTYSGGTTLNQGTMNLRDGSAIGTGTLTINGGTIDNTSASAMTLNNNNNQVWGGNFTFTGSSDLNLGAGNVTLNSNPNITVSNSILTVGGPIANGSGNGFTKLGSGTLVLSGSNTFTGAVNISEGTVMLGSTTALGSNAGPTNISGGGMLDINGIANLNTTKQFQVSGFGVSNQGAIINSGAGTASNELSRLTLTGNASIGGTGRWDFRGNNPVIDLAGFNLSKVGTNLIAMVSGTIKNTGATTNTIEVTSGTFSIEAATSTVGTNGAILYDANVMAQFFQNTGSVTWPMTFAGGNIIGNAGTVSATIASPMTLNGNVTFEPVNVLVEVPNNNDPLTLTGTIAESGGSYTVTKLGVNTLTLGGAANNWTGGTLLKQGTLALGSSNGFPAGSSLTFGDATNFTSGTFDLAGFNATVGTVTDASGGSSNIITNSSTIANSTLTIAGNNTLDETINDLQGMFSGTTTLAVNVTSGTVVFNNFNNYSGGTTVSGTGTVQMGSGQSQALGISGSNLTVNAGGTVDLNGNSPTFGALSGTGGSITNTSSNSVQLTLGATANSTFGGVISNGAGGGTTSLTKQNNGALILTGNNTYTGNTTVNGGTLVVNGSLNLASNIMVNQGTLSGSGTVGNVTLQDNNGIITPHSTTGTTATLTIGSSVTPKDLTVNAGNLQFNLSAGNISDQIVVKGNANFNSSWNLVVDASTGGLALPAGTYTLLTSNALNAGQPLTGGGNATGTLPTLITPGARQTTSLSYPGVGNNSIVLTVGAANPATLIWNNLGGAGDGSTWDKATSTNPGQQNWSSATANGGSGGTGGPDVFYSADTVIFNDNNNHAPPGSNSNAYNVQISSVVQPASITVNTSGTYTFGGGGSIGGSGSLTKQGAGTLILSNSGTNTYSGATAIQNGMLQLGATAALPTGTALSFGNGSGTTTSTLDLGGNNATVSSITENGGINTIGNSGGGTATLNYAGSGPSTFTGTFRDGLGAGGGQLALNVASGSLSLSGPVSYTGDTTINGSLQISGAHSGVNAETLPGVISGGGNLTVGDGVTATVLTLPGANTYTGVTTIRNGSMVIAPTLAAAGTASSIGAAAVAPTNLVLDGGTLQWAAATNGVSTNRGFTLTPNGGTLDVSPTVGGVNTTISGAINESGTGSRTLTLTGIDQTPLAIAGQTLSGNLADPTGGQLSIVKNGSSGWVLSGTNSYSGAVTINAGRIRASSTTAFGTGPVSVADGASAYLPTSGTFSNNFSIAGIGIAETGTTVDNHYGSLRLAANGTIVAGTVTLTGDARITGRSASTSGGVISGKITGNHALEFGNSNAVGVLTISNTANNWIGDTTVSLGTLKAGAASTPTAGVIPHGAGFGNVIVNGGDANGATALSTFDINGFNVTINGLSSSGVLAQDIVANTGPLAATLTVGDNNAGGSFGGSIQDGANGISRLALTKTGSGIQILNGVNTYTGATAVNQGTLSLGVANSIATTAQVALNGGTLATGGVDQDFTTSALPATLALTASSTLDLGTAANSASVKLANSSGVAWTPGQTLTIANWNYGVDHLYIGAANTNTGLTVSQLAAFKFSDFATGASIRANAIGGEVVPRIGDINQDGTLSTADISTLMTALSNETAYQNQYFPAATHSDPAGDVAYILDVDGNGQITNADIQTEISRVANFVAAGNSFGAGGGSVTAVPEPTSLLLLGLGGALLLAGRARRKFA